MTGEGKSGSRKPKPVTATYLDRAATAYLQRYASSSENLRRVLLRKVRRRLEPGQPFESHHEALVAETVDRAIRSGLLDDRLYLETKLASLARKGASPRAMRSRLAQKGLPTEAVDAALAAEPPDELALARRFAERKRLGSWRKTGRDERRDKDIAALCRAGFSYRIARAALEPEDESVSS